MIARTGKVGGTLKWVVIRGRYDI